jgi:hypothetical protein
LNFKIFILFSLLWGCGVKGDPASPKTEKLPSLMDNYQDIKIDNTFDETKKMKR